MGDFLKNIVNKTAIFGFLAGLILMFWRIDFGLGLWLGILVGQITLRLSAYYYDQLLFQGQFKWMGFIFFAIVNYGLMALALYFGIIFTKIFNIYLVAVGLVMVKYGVYVAEIHISKRKG
jgi:hypothetical protein